VKLSLPLRGPRGERVDLARTLDSHGVASLPPLEPLNGGGMRMTIRAGRGRPRTVVVRPGPRRSIELEVLGRAPSEAGARAITEVVRHVLGLDMDLSGFYAQVRDDPDLSWAAQGAGRMVRSPTLFEEVVKTVCTTNCSWALTVRMVSALVQHLGEPAAGAPGDDWRGRAFPTPQAMAEADERFYREVVRSGYRAPYFRSLGRLVADGDVDIEGWGSATREEVPDAELAKLLQTLPGVGPYAAAHIMMMIGRHSLLILDSWTRPTYAKLVGKRSVSDATIERRFRRYGDFAGLAFWLFLTRSWVPDQANRPNG